MLCLSWTEMTTVTDEIVLSELIFMPMYWFFGFSDMIPKGIV